MNEETVPTKDMALRLGVTPESVRRWVREGRLRAVRVGARYKIPVVDAILFISEYEREFGKLLEPDIPVRPPTYRVQRKPQSCPEGRQSLYVTVQTEMLHMVDDERREETQRISRSEFIEAAVGYYVNTRKRDRLNKMRGKNE